jgi:arylsulfatase A-like enzyme
MASVAPPPPRPAQLCASAALVGAGVGGLLSVVDAVVVPRLSPGDAYPFADLVAGVAVGAAIGSVTLLAAAGLGSLVLRRARPVALGLVATVSAAFAVFHLSALVLRVLAGAYVTVDAIAFGLAGGAHLLATTWSGYRGYVLATGFTACTMALATAWLVARAMRRPVSARRAARLLAAAVSAPLAALVLLLGTAPTRELGSAASGTSPELALLVSVGERFTGSEPVLPPPVGRDGADAGADAAPVPEPGPSRLASSAWESAMQAPAARRPNVLLVTLESVSVAHLGYFGYPRPVTPNLDRIAKRSLRMRRAWTTSTHSNYAQMAILSSLFPRRGTGLDQYDRLDYPRVLFHDLLHAAGYVTATISSQNEGWQGMRRFEETGTPTYFWSADDWTGATVDIGSERVIPDELTAQRAIEWMTKQHGKRFALYVNFQETHFPYSLPDGAEEPFAPSEPRGEFNYLAYGEEDRQTVENRYDNALHYVDEQVGKLERFLARAGLLDDTLLVVTADHGEMFGDHGTVTHGKTLFEGESRVPLLVHWPGHVRPSDVDEPVSHVDILPTIAELAGLPVHPAFQGTSFADLAAHQRAHVAVFVNDQGLRMAEGVVCWPWKLVNDRTGRTLRLYQLEDDPEELEDRTPRDPAVASALADVLSAQMKAQMDYHRESNRAARRARFAPRLLACPEVTTAPSRVGHR